MKQNQSSTTPSQPPDSGIEEINQVFYDKLYRKTNPFLLLAHPLVSFDQQSKSKLNFRLLKGILRERKSRGLPPPSHLDYGFGHGSLLLKFPRSCPASGCDLSPEAVNSLRALCGWLGRRMSLYTVEAFEANTADARFDLITCSHVLEHVESDDETLGMLASRLAPDGRILINLPINEVWDDPKHLRRYDLDAIQSLLSRCGLAMVTTRLGDRWTGFFLRNEMVHPLPRLFRPCLRALRLLFAVLPLAVVEGLEWVLAGRYQPQQVLVLARKE